MIDLHCHMLAGIDDGPTTIEQSLEMARMAVKNGITKSVLTPHIHIGRYDNNYYTIYRKYKELETFLELMGIPLKLEMAAEIRLGEEILPFFKKAIVPSLGELDGYKIILLEFPHGHIPVGSDKLVKHLLSMGIKPMIAHPERNKDVIRDINKIVPFLELGCMLQLTSSSLTGGFGAKCKQRADEMLSKGWISVIATDSHNTIHRPPALAEGRKAAEKIVGADAARNLVQDFPQQIISNKKLSS